MAKFKAGDKVRKKNGDTFSNDDLVVTIAEKVNPDGHPYFVETDTWHHTNELELVTPVIAPAITAPTPAPSAIRTVTRREIVPGEYLDGNVRIIANGCALVRDWSDASKARAAASLFNELADVLDENAGEAV